MESMATVRKNRVELKDLVSYLASNLVDEPDTVQVREIQNGDTVILEVSVAPDDMGKVIGRHGRVARAIRTVTKAAAARQGRRAMVEALIEEAAVRSCSQSATSATTMARLARIVVVAWPRLRRN